MKTKNSLLLIFLTLILISPILSEAFVAKKPPVVKTLVDPLTIATFVETNFDFNGTVKSTVLSCGVNDIYLIEIEEEKYVLRLSRADKTLTLSEPEFLFELEWLLFLHQQQIPVSYPISKHDNQLFGYIEAPEGPRYATLFSYAPGNTDMSNEQAYLLGQALANLHGVSNNFKTHLEPQHLDIEQLIDEPLNQIKHVLNDSWRYKSAFLDELAEKLKKQISNLHIDPETYGIIAGDVHGYNQHFTEDNQLTMFDFEFCAYGYRIYDIATFKWSRGSSDFKLWNAFLDGYQSVRTLTYAEIKTIDVFVKARNLWWISSMSKLPEYQNELDDEFWEYAFSRF